VGDYLALRYILPRMKVTRRSILKAAAAGALAPAIGFGQARSDDKLILCAPLTHSDWFLKPKIAWGAEGVKHMLDQCKACGWSRVLWRVFDAGKSTYKSKLLAPGETPESDSFYNPQTDQDRALLKKYSPNITPQRLAELNAAFVMMDYANFDSLAAAIEYGHKIGLQIWAWATINEDDHGWGWRSEFAKAHPEFRWVRRDGRPYRSQMSFAFAEVRAYKLDLVRELLAYDIDGLFLDWVRTGDVRDNPQNDADGVADYGYEQATIAEFKKRFEQDPRQLSNGDARWVQLRCEPQTIFMREARTLVRSMKRIPMCAMVAQPWHYRGLLDKIDGNRRGLLLDVKQWAEEGLVDAVIPAGYYRDGGDASKAYRALREETDNKVDVWYYAWVPQTAADFERDFASAKEVGAKQMLFWEADYIDDRASAAELKKAMLSRAER
jgi:hypothetical protein